MRLCSFRDGAAVEIQGLAKSVLTWLAQVTEAPFNSLPLESADTRFVLSPRADSSIASLHLRQPRGNSSGVVRLA